MSDWFFLNFENFFEYDFMISMKYTAEKNFLIFFKFASLENDFKDFIDLLIFVSLFLSTVYLSSFGASINLFEIFFSVPKSFLVILEAIWQSSV